MKVHTGDIGYRELDRLSDFMHELAKRGVSVFGGDYPVSISYELWHDRSVCICGNGKLITSDDIDV